MTISNIPDLKDFYEFEPYASLDAYMIRVFFLKLKVPVFVTHIKIILESHSPIVFSPKVYKTQISQF